MRIPEGYAQVIHSFTLANDPEPIAVTYGIGPEPAAPAVVYSDAIAAELHDAWGDEVMNVISSVYTLKSTEVIVTVEETPPAASVYIHSADRVGLQPATALPQNSALLVHKRTAQAGRTGRGRMYVPGIVEGSVGATGIVTSTELTSYQTRLTAFLARFGTGVLADISMFLFHGDRADGTPAAFPDRVTSLVVDPIIATQRRRLRR